MRSNEHPTPGHHRDIDSPGFPGRLVGILAKEKEDFVWPSMPMRLFADTPWDESFDRIVLLINNRE